MLRGLAAGGGGGGGVVVSRSQLAETRNKMTKSRDHSNGGKVKIADQHVSTESLLALSPRLKCISFS